MVEFKRWNNITGWFVFLTALTVYLLTLEPTVSYWDCGEFIAAAYKLEVNHPPGAPLFLMLAKCFSLLAPDKTKVAISINAMSALASAFTILFLFWTITRLAAKLVLKTDVTDKARFFGVLGAGIVGALAYTFSDTFWFSAVEAEVYATSSLFTALVFWSILKWEDEIDKPYGNRWIILIAYLIGLSIGVHLLSLLTIPAVCLVFYFKKFKPTTWGFLLAVLCSFALLALVQFGIISGILDLAAWSEIYAVNTLKLPYNSGIIIFSILLLFILSGGILLSIKFRKPAVNTVFLALMLILAGYSSYALIVIRSKAGPPMNENRPDNILSLISYIDRDEYGSTPFFYGPYYNAPITRIKDGAPVYRRSHGRYVVAYHIPVYSYDPRFETFFPRMYSRDKSHINVYKTWGNVKGTPVVCTSGHEHKTLLKPTFLENLTFFLKYQVGYMYFRYFGWNFIGRQNNIDGDGGILYGNCISGIGFIDSLFYGPQNRLPARMKENKGRNTYFFLPFLLGLMGALYQCKKSRPWFSVVLMLFFMTGIAIVVYLNQTPLQVRERDYAYVGSFYAFSIWIGLGVVSLLETVWKRTGKFKGTLTAVLLSFLAVPVLMAKENWTDHDRSGRYTAHDVAYDYLNSCAPDAILFTDGDNDTFPLWYLQEVEGVRTDVRVVNSSLLTFDWYIDPLKKQIYNSPPLPVTLPSADYRAGKCDYVYFTGDPDSVMDLNRAVAYIASTDSSKKLILDSGETIDCLPTHHFSLKVDTARVFSNGTVNRRLRAQVLSALPVHFSRDYILKNKVIVMDILAHNHWKRPVYYLSPGSDCMLGLRNYTQLEGFAYRLVPIYTRSQGLFQTGRIEADTMYNRFMHTFRWGRMNQKGVLIDNVNIDMAAIERIRVNFSRLAEQLYREGKKDSARSVIARCVQLMPSGKYPHDIFSLTLADAAYQVKATAFANQIVSEYAGQCFEDLRFYHSMPPRLLKLVGYENALAGATLDKLVAMAKKYNQTALNQHIKERLKHFK